MQNATQTTAPIPQSFIDSCVWSHSQLSSTESPWHPWVFEDDMLSAVQNAVSCAFNHVKPVHEDKTRSEKAVTVCAPYFGGHEIVDAVVKIIAQRENAGVLVLDSLDLASGRFGTLGDGGSFVNIAYKKLPIKTFSDTHDIEEFFDHLVRAGLDQEEPTTRRIIYMREFGAIAAASTPLMIYLLRAIDRLRSTTTTSAILLLGASRQLGRAGRPDYYGSSNSVYKVSWYFKNTGIPRNYSEMFQKGGIPRSIMPSIGATVSSYSSLSFKSLSEHFFGPIFDGYPCGSTLTVCHVPVPEDADKSGEEKGEGENNEEGGKHGEGGNGQADTSHSNTAEEAALVDQSIHQATVGDSSDHGDNGVATTPEVVEDLSANNETVNTSESTKSEDPDLQNPMWWKERVQCLTKTLNPRSGVYAEDVGLHQQQSALKERLTAVNNLLCNLMLEKKGIILKNGTISLAELTKREEPHVTIKENKTLEYAIVSPSFFDDSFFESLFDILDQNPESGKPLTLSVEELRDALEAQQKWNERLKKWVDREIEKRCNVPSDPKESDSDSDSDSDNDAEDSIDAVIQRVRNSSDLTQHEKRLLSCIVDAKSLSTSFEDVILNKQIIQGLRSIVSLPLLHPHHFRTGILSREALSGALLYGPPGTGKTMVCRALACESGARMILIKPSDVFNMWVGESEKIAKAVFTLANKLAPCVVFIDEVDTLFGARTSGKNGRTDLTEFMQCMDGLNSGSSSKDKGVIVVGATNRPYDLDQAILRRLPCRMLVDLPGEAERESILKSHLNGEELEGVDLKDVAADTDGYSGSDLKTAMEALRDTIGDLVFEPVKQKDQKSASTATGNEEPKHVEQLIMDTTPMPPAEETEKTNEESVPKRVIKMGHFHKAYTQVAASFTLEGNKELYAWHAKYGSNMENPTNGQRKGKVAKDSCELRESGYRKQVEPVSILEQPISIQELGRVVMSLGALSGGVRA
ncbi:mitochondrial aaa [Moniliophthora roreri]|nr:mitochondrial aaa [Moniliophthora roreri]